MDLLTGREVAFVGMINPQNPKVETAGELVQDISGTGTNAWFYRGSSGPNLGSSEIYPR
jgi:hypothetical protein